MRAKFEMPHPAIVVSGPQLDKVIEELEAGTYPQPEDAIWRGDLPVPLAVRLAKATGATALQIAEILAEKAVDPELYKNTAPAWNCISDPEEGPHYLRGDWCVWCGKGPEERAHQYV